MKQKYIIYGGGDMSVGIPHTDAVITIEDNNEGRPEHDDIQFIKKFFAEYYDVPISVVKTEEEVRAENEEYQRSRRA